MEKVSNNNENFCSKTGKKLNEVCPSCWVKGNIPYKCEYAHCPGKKLYLLESEKEEEKTKNGGSEMEDLIKIAEEQIERLKEEQNPYGDDVVINASKEIRYWCCFIASIQRDKAIQEMNEQMKEIKQIKIPDIEEVVTKLNELINQGRNKINVRNDKDIKEVATNLGEVKMSEIIDQAIKHMKENMKCKGAL